MKGNFLDDAARGGEYFAKRVKMRYPLVLQVLFLIFGYYYPSWVTASVSPLIVTNGAVLGSCLAHWWHQRMIAYNFRKQCYKAELALLVEIYKRVSSSAIGAMSAAIGEEKDVSTFEDLKREAKKLEKKWQIKKRDRSWWP